MDSSPICSPRSLCPSSSRAGPPRRALWDLPGACHEALLACHWRPAELRRLTDRLYGGRSKLDAPALLAAAVAQCASRNSLSMTLQRALDRRHAEALRQGAARPDAAAMAAAWAEALHDGDVQAALWVTLSDARCDDALCARVLQELWTLQGALVAARQAETEARRRLQAEMAAARDDLARQQQRHHERQAETAAAMAALQTELATLRGQVQAQQARIDALQAQRAPALSPAREALVQRVAALSRQLAALQPRPVAEAPAPSVAEVRAVADPAPAMPPDSLREARVLCVGGRSAQVPHYRALVESQGGRFMHHDGGLKDNPHRLDAQLAGADLVLCQAGCLNHNAYARVKAHCKRHDKPCVYLDAPGMGRLLRGLAERPLAG